MPSTLPAPSSTAAMASTPDPVPTSTRRLPRRSRSCSSLRHSRVVSWWPVPNPIDGGMTIRCVSSGSPGGMSHGGATTSRPTRTWVRLAWLRAAQSSSSISTSVTRQPSAANSSCNCAATPLVPAGSARKTRHSGSASEPASCTAASPAPSRATATRSGRSGWVERGGKKSSSAGTRRGTSAEDVLHAVEDVAVVLCRERPRLGLLGWQRLRELLQDLTLFLCELFRDVGVHGDAQIAPATARDVGQPLAAQPEHRPGRGALRDFQRLLLLAEARHLELAAQRERREGDADVAEQVVALALQELVVLHLHDDVEVAGRAAGDTGLALALNPEPLSRRDPRRDLHGELALLQDAALAVAGGARLGDHLARAAALATGASDGEEALLV